MGLVSGTIDIMPGITRLAQADAWSGGAQVVGTVRSGDNEAGYTLGNRLMGTLWAAVPLGERFSVSTRFAGETWGNIDGADLAFAGARARRLVPTVFPELRGGSCADIGVGFNMLIKKERPSQTRLAFAVLIPLYRRLDGPQLETDYRIATGLQYIF